MLAIGKGKEIEDSENWLQTAMVFFPSLWVSASSPDPAYEIDSVGGLVVYLNDRAGWTRERIADMLVERGWDCDAVLAEPPQSVCEEVCA